MTAHASESLDRRLKDGAQWARAEGRPRLGSLLEDVLKELQALRRQVATAGCTCDLEALGDPEDVASQLQDMDKRLDDLERQVADLE